MSRVPRFVLDTAPAADGTAVITGQELHHMRDVMRLRAGCAVTLLAPDGSEYLAEVTGFGAERATVRISSRHSPHAPVRLILAAAIIKGPRMDFLVEKAAELGTAELRPVMCARGVVRSPGSERVQRWRRLATAATKQSLSPLRMEVRAPMLFTDLVAAVPADTLPVICTPGGEPLAGAIRRLAPATILLAVGPEGDFAPAEMALAQEAGFIAAGLGATRLRSETAALAALGIAAGALDELRRGG